MRVVMIRAVERSLRQHPLAKPFLYVDDLAAHAVAPEDRVVEELCGFIEKVVDFIEATGQELSTTKSVCIASSKRLGNRMIRRWRSRGIKIH